MMTAQRKKETGFVTSRQKRDAGFTLVEMLIALFIFALISAGTITVLSSALNAKAQMDARLTALQNIDSARALIKSDMTHMVLRQNRDSLGSNEPYILSGGANTLITFTRAGRINPGGLEPRGDLQRVSYVFENNRLLRRSLVHANPAPQTPVMDRVLVSGLSDVSLTFLNRTSANGLLQSNTQIFIRPATTSFTLNAVRLDLTFENGDSLEQIFEIDL